jgi:hypothetical protein
MKNPNLNKFVGSASFQHPTLFETSPIIYTINAMNFVESLGTENFVCKARARKALTPVSPITQQARFN